jgi:hypothetical protein
LVILEATTLNIFYTQDVDLMMDDRIVQRPWEESPFESPLNTYNPMDVE